MEALYWYIGKFILPLQFQSKLFLVIFELMYDPLGNLLALIFALFYYPRM
jgi:hypothetical protein